MSLGPSRRHLYAACPDLINQVARLAWANIKEGLLGCGLWCQAVVRGLSYVLVPEPRHSPQVYPVHLKSHLELWRKSRFHYSVPVFKELCPHTCRPVIIFCLQRLWLSFPPLPPGFLQLFLPLPGSSALATQWHKLPALFT